MHEQLRVMAVLISYQGVATSYIPQYNPRSTKFISHYQQIDYKYRLITLNLQGASVSRTGGTGHHQTAASRHL